ncbi:MAG: TIGR03862 family flavoprotein [Chloroflexi bacterium]|nr:MAG: TIGR03862 family flavoprotein [Chloroflexota bacterium]
MDKSVAVIGGGPAGLMAAEVVSAGGAKVDLYDSMPSLGRKFLMAGKGGLNITHSEPFEQFVSRYRKRRPQIKTLLKTFGPNELLQWIHGLGIETFVGTSGRVFPMGMKASPLLRAWLKRLTDSGVTFHLRHKWRGWLPSALAAVPGGGTAARHLRDAALSLLFATPEGEKIVTPDATVLALGGGSWSRLGSDGAWLPWLEQAGVRVEALKPSNCGFDVDWSPHFRERFEGQPVKSVVLSFGSFRQQGEFIVTKEGLEGSLIYAASALLRDEIDSKGNVTMTLDLAPDRSLEWLVEKLSKPRGARTMASHLEKTAGIKGVKAGLLREFVAKEDFANVKQLASSIKALLIPLIAPRPLDEAISSAGGVTFESLDEHLMIRSMPGIFCAGEMLDWEAPTGGYLITACLASGYAAGNGVLKWLEASTNH